TRRRRPDRATALAIPSTETTKTQLIDAKPVRVAYGGTMPERIHVMTRPSETTTFGTGSVTHRVTAARRRRANFHCARSTNGTNAATISAPARTSPATFAAGRRPGRAACAGMRGGT